MLDTRFANDQAAGLRQLMMPSAAKLVTVALASTDLDSQHMIRLLHAEMDLSRYDKIGEFKAMHYSNYKTNMPALGKIVICLNHSANSIKEAYRLIKLFSEHTYGQPIGVFMLASCASQAKTIFYNLSSVSSMNLGVAIDLVGYEIIKKSEHRKIISPRFAVI